MIFENYYLYRAAIWLIARLPEWFVHGCAVVLAELNYLLNPRGRAGIYANLAHVLPADTPKHERRRIARLTFRNFALSIADFFRIPQMNSVNADDFIAEVRGWEHLRSAMEARIGAILMSVHVGSWELAGAYLGLRGVPITAVALPHRDPRVDGIFLESRRATGIEIVPLGGAVRRLYETLKRGRFVAMAADRDYTGQGELLPFFGQIARMPMGPAKLSLRTGAWILPALSYRRDDGRLVIEVRPPIRPDPFEDTEYSLALRCIAVLEDFIRARPEQWSAFEDYWAPRLPVPEAPV
jgi:KDO2-lipid IV(A) lauroyltransferase